MLDRYIDDYAFHQFVRPVLNQELRAGGVDPTLLVPAAALEEERRNRRLLWPYALRLLRTLYPQYQDTGMIISLPWQRTFETQIDVDLTSKLPAPRLTPAPPSVDKALLTPRPYSSDGGMR